MEPVVRTIESKCKRCYSCIRNCPANAIRVENGQATVLFDRCVACGYCVRVCPQNAKMIRDGTQHALQLLSDTSPVIAIIAPSFPAAFDSCAPGQVVAALKKLGFSKVMEVAFGADLVAEEYQKINSTGVMPVLISSPCPVVVNFIEKYFPDLLLFLAPVVSPMIALGRVIKESYQPEAKVVFIGPCVAKKREMEDTKISGVIDEVLTFQELANLFVQQGIIPADLPEKTFDGPVAGLGRIFTVSGGLLKTAALGNDLLQNDIIVTEGRDRVLDALEKVHEGKIEAEILDLLFCEGCINGPRMLNDLSVFIRKDRVVNYFRDHDSAAKRTEHQKDKEKYRHINLRREFTREMLPSKHATEAQIREVLAVTGKFSPEDELNCGSCGYPTCRQKAIAVIQGLAEAEMCLPYMVEKLQTIQNELIQSNTELRESLETLNKTQQQLIQSEKLASVGQLAAGVAHELNNPLGGILLYTGLLLENIDHKGQEHDDLKRIAAETERCRRIVRGLLDFSRQTRIEAAIIDLNKIVIDTLALLTQQALFHNIKLARELEPDLPKVFVDVGQMQQVFLNIILNAAEAMNGKGSLMVKTRYDAQQDLIIVIIQDNGPGMSPDVMKKIFDPFFTTKPRGKGTGLGLAIAYGIVKKHRGDILVESTPGQGAKFLIHLPTAKNMENSSFESERQNIIGR